MHVYVHVITAAAAHGSGKPARRLIIIVAIDCIAGSESWRIGDDGRRHFHFYLHLHRKPGAQPIDEATSEMLSVKIQNKANKETRAGAGSDDWPCTIR